MLKHAKPINQLLTAPPWAQMAMENFATYLDAYTELRSDIGERFDYPSLWAAIDSMVSHHEKYIKALMEMQQAGFTTDDAFALAQYHKNETVEPRRFDITATITVTQDGRHSA